MKALPKLIGDVVVKVIPSESGLQSSLNVMDATSPASKKRDTGSQSKVTLPKTTPWRC